MKFALVLLAFVATASAKIEIPNFGRGELAPVIQEFLDMVPAEQIIALTLQYYAQDAEFQKMVAYFQTEGFKQLVVDVEALPEIKALMDYIHNAGIDIYKIVNEYLNKSLGLPPLTPPSVFIGTQIKGGIRGYVDEVKAMLPLKELEDLYNKKLAESKAFKEFIDQLKSENFQNIVNKVYVHPKFQELLQHAKDYGIDVAALRDLMELFWGITIPHY